MFVLCLLTACGVQQQESAEVSSTAEEQVVEHEGEVNVGTDNIETEEMEEVEENEESKENIEKEEIQKVEESQEEEIQKVEESQEEEESQKAEESQEEEESQKAEESQEEEEIQKAEESQEEEEISQESKQDFLIWYDGDKKLTDLYWKWESDSEWKVVWEHQTIEAGTGADFAGTYKEEAFMVKMAFDDGEVGEATLALEDVKKSKADAENMGGYLVYYIYPIGIWW